VFFSLKTLRFRLTHPSRILSMITSVPLETVVLTVSQISHAPSVDVLLRSVLITEPRRCIMKKDISFPPVRFPPACSLTPAFYFTGLPDRKSRPPLSAERELQFAALALFLPF